MTAAAKLLVVAAAVAAVGGCEPPGKVSRMMPRPVADIDRLGIHVGVAAMSWDEEPGPDGVFVKVYCYQLHQPKTVTVKGVLEFLLFEGSVSASTIDKAEPFQTWKFTGEQLSAHAVRSMVGWGYAMQLAWDKDVPKAGKITLLARYISATGVQTFSAPVSIPMAG